jgi:NADPH-dependent 2,4-dienoyl-CoA reductase/sulfur reductase-like enzyme
MNSRERIVIVGGGPAAQATAKSYRDHGGGGDVTILAAESRPPYQRPPLSKEYLRGEADEPELPLCPPSWYREADVSLQLGTRVKSLDLAATRVVDERGRSWPFDRCVLATGSSPAVPEIKGIDHTAVRTLRRVEDADRLIAETGPSVTVAVVGSGFIGCEAAVSLAARGAEVSLVTDEEAPQIDRLGEEASARIGSWIEEAEVELHCGSGVEAVGDGDHGGVRLRTESAELETDLALIALGAARNTELAADAGIELEDGLVSVDACMRTGREGILAAGDIALAMNAAAGRRLPVEHWGEALNHGETAGATLAGAEKPWAVAPGFWSVIGERTLKQVAWGDGFERAELETDGDEAFAIRYFNGRELVGVLAHDCDDAYEAGREQLEAP